MKKENFATLVMTTIGGFLFAIGMCMCLLPAWSAFVPGIVMGSIGAAVLLIMLLVRRKMQGKPAIKITGKTVGVAAVGVIGALALGFGMCMCMVWGGLIMIPGIIVGVVGIAALLFLIPLCKGIK